MRPHALLPVTLLASATVFGEGSEFPDDSVTIDALPFADSGDTSDNLDDFDAVCPFSGSTAPDVFYAYTGASAGLAISLCESAYDTKVYVLDTAFNEIACNDDACSDSNGNPFRSRLDCVETPGTVVHIAIDGWMDASGVYDLVVDSCDPAAQCVFTDECPDTARAEDEPCDDGGNPDLVNGGCDAASALFFDVAPNDTVCGELWAMGGLRDTDWYRLDFESSEGIVSFEAIAELPIVIGYVAGCPDGAPDCACVTGIDPMATGAPCEHLAVTRDGCSLTGESWWFVAPTVLDLIPCAGEDPGNDYVCAWIHLADQQPGCCERGDLNEDGSVDFTDLIWLIAGWGPCESEPCCAYGDNTGDGQVDFQDLIQLLGAWGPCPDC